VLSDFPQNAQYVCETPRKDVDEQHFLFRVEGGADPHRLALRDAGVEGYDLGVLRSLEASDMIVGGAEGLVGLLIRSATRASSSVSASVCSTHLTSHLNACSNEGPTVMMPLGPDILSFKYM
jgi:hypothetical protein